MTFKKTSQCPWVWTYILVWYVPKTKGSWKCNAFIRWRNMYSSQAKNVQQSIVKTNTDLRGNERVSSHALLAPFFTLWLHFSLRPGGKAVSRSHTWTYINVTATQRTQQACLWETSWPRWSFPVQLLTQLQKMESFQRASFVCWSGSTRMVRADPLDIRLLERKHVIMWTDTLTLRVLIFTLSVVTHCLGQLPLKQTTKALCKELTPY